MGDPWKNVPGDLEHRVQQKAKRAESLGIAGDLVAKYARILIAAEEVVSNRAQEEQDVRDEATSVAAAEHGIYEDDPQKARASYATARKSERQLYNSVAGLAKTLIRFEKVLKAGHRFLQVDVSRKFPLEAILGASSFIKAFAQATIPHPANLAEIEITKSEFSLTLANHTFLWWNTYVAHYEGRWEHMHALARCWNLTKVKDVEDFRRMVVKVKPTLGDGGGWILGCPRWAIPKSVTP